MDAFIDILSECLYFQVIHTEGVMKKDMKQ